MVARPGADLNAVRLRVEGADDVALAGDRLRLHTAVGIFALPLLQVVTPDGALIAPAGAARKLHDNNIATPFLRSPAPTSGSIAQGESDLLYSTFIGGAGGAEESHGIAVGANRATYIAGYTRSADFPTTPGAFDRSLDDYDVFVAKLNPAGSDLVYATLVGGSDIDYANEIALDGDGAAYVVGSIASNDFPTTPGAYDRNGSGVDKNHRDVYVFKLNPDGTGLDYSTFLGGSETDNGYAIAVGPAGAAYVTGRTFSTDFPTQNAYDQSFNGVHDVFVTKLNSTGSRLAYSTLLGGGASDSGINIVVDGNGVAYVTGYTASTDFPLTNAFDTSFGGVEDAIVVKLNPGGSTLSYSTLLGDSDTERGDGIAVDASGAAYITGSTNSAGFPTTPGAYDTSANGLSDSFVVKLNATGTGPLLYGTFLGGAQDDRGKEIVIDGTGAAYIVGTTASPAFPTTVGAYDTSYNGGESDVFMVKLAIGSSPAVSYATFLGCDAAEFGDGIAVDGGGHAYLVGFTYSSTFPTTPGAYDPSFNGGDRDAFIAKFGFGTPPKYFIAGQVRDGDGAPVAGVTITPDTGQPVTTGADGTYRIDQLEPGAYIITPSRSGYTFTPPQRQVSVPPDVGGQNFTVTTPLYAISGQVTNSSNNPVAGITVSDGSGHTTTTSSDGTYTITNLQAGTYTITPAREGYSFQPASRAVSVPPDATSRNFIAEDLTPTFTIRGRVTSGGKPLAGITIADNQSHTTTTNADGIYTLTSLRQGTYTITASGGGYAFEPKNRTLSVPPSAETQDFFDTTPLVHNTWLPLIMMIRQVGPPPCNSYEPNNYRLVDPWGPLESDRTYEAKICANDQEGRFPDSKYEDNYFFEATTSEPVKVKLTIPLKLVNHFAIAIYESGRLNHVEGCYIDQVTSVTYDMPLCRIPKPGRYIIRLFSTEEVVDNDNFYTFLVQFE